MNLIYNEELFSEESIIRLISIFENILNEIIIDSYQNVLSLNYLNESEYNKIVYEWNETDAEFPEDKTIHELFEESVERTPDNIALIFEDIKLTYKELNERANRLARHLREEYHIKPDDLIALFLDRNEYMIIAIIAVWKSGAAYVPIDPSYPDKRIEYILNDCKSNLLLTNLIQFLNEIFSYINIYHYIY